jgi:hypothetical protein
MAVPEAFAPADVKALDDTMHKMMHVSFQKKTQTTLHEVCDMQYVLFMLCAIEIVHVQLAKRSTEPRRAALRVHIA